MESYNTELVTVDLKMRKAIEQAKTIAVTKTPALIQGETGTGKRSLAALIHGQSSRKNGPFNLVDCQKDSTTLENEILGYREEATGKFFKGILELSNGGTVVFSNIDCLEDGLQKRIHSILLELNDYDLDVRIIATTTKNLSKLVAAGRFNRMLYSYFANTQIQLVPLRERLEDLMPVAQYLLRTQLSFESEFTFSEDAIQKLKSLNWPHNVAELKNTLHNAAKNSQNNLIDLAAIESVERSIDVKGIDMEDDGVKLMSLREAEKLLIKKALIYTSENRTQAAKILGVSIRTLRNKINEYRSDGTNYFLNLR